MNRRRFIRKVGGMLALSVATAGCLGDDETGGREDECAIENAGELTEPVTARLDGREDNADFVLPLQWNARTQRSFANFSGPDEGEVAQLYRLSITNTSDVPVEIGPMRFQLEYTTPDIRDTTTGTTLIGYEDDFEIVELRSGGTYEGVYTFYIPEEASETMLMAFNGIISGETIQDNGLAYTPECDQSFVGWPEE